MRIRGLGCYQSPFATECAAGSRCLLRPAPAPNMTRDRGLGQHHFDQRRAVGGLCTRQHTAAAPGSDSAAARSIPRNFAAVRRPAARSPPRESPRCSTMAPWGDTPGSPGCSLFLPAHPERGEFEDCRKADRRLAISSRGADLALSVNHPAIRTQTHRRSDPTATLTSK